LQAVATLANYKNNSRKVFMSNQRGSTLNLLPVLILIAIASGAGYYLMQGELKLPKLVREPNVRRLADFPTSVEMASPKDLEKQRVVIKSQEELQEFFAHVDENGELALEEKIDFDQEYLLGISSSLREKAQGKIKVKKIYADRQDQSYLVMVERTERSDECLDLEYQDNVLVDLVAIDKTDWEIDFETVKTENSRCKKAEEPEETEDEVVSETQDE